MVATNLSSVRDDRGRKNIRHVNCHVLRKEKNREPHERDHFLTSKEKLHEGRILGLGPAALFRLGFAHGDGN